MNLKFALRFVPSVFIVSTLFFVFGCNSNQTTPDVMAKVNSHKIMKADVDKYYDNQTAGSPQQPTGEQATSLRLSILKELIDNEILMQRTQLKTGRYSGPDYFTLD